MPSSLNRCCLFLLCLLPSIATAANLDVSLAGVSGEPRKNVRAYLGASPDTESDRLNFVSSARSKVTSALQALGYYQAHIVMRVIRTDPVWKLKIAIELGEPVRIRQVSIQIDGEAAGDDKITELVASAPFANGDALHHGRFENFRKRLQSLAQQRGYLDGKYLQSRVAVQVQSGTADVLLIFDSGLRYRFGQLSYDHADLEEDLLESLSTFSPGDYYDQRQLRELQSRLQRTNYYSSVVVQPLPDQADGDRVPVEVRLQSAARHNFDVGLGYSTDTQDRVSLSWRTPKINRYGHSQVTRLEYSPVNPSGRFTYSIPLTNPLTDIAQLWARLEENEYGDIDSRQIEAGARRETKTGKWIYAYSLRGLNESWELLDTKTANDYLLLGGSLSSREHSGLLVDPSGGFNQLYSLEAGSEHIGSDVDVLRGTAEYRFVYTPWDRQRVVTRAELGAVEVGSGDRDDLAPSLGFFAGGSQSIRGYAYQSLGKEFTVQRADGTTKRLVVAGDRLVIGSLEYQYYFTDKWRGAVFVDAGDAFDQGDFDAKVGAGFGVHYITPVGAIRVELANSVSEEKPDWYFHLTIGAEF